MIETDATGFPIEVSDLDADWLLALTEDAETQARAAERRKLRYAAQWCALHPATPHTDHDTGRATWAEAALPGALDCDETIGGPGTPAVAAFTAEPFAAALRHLHHRRPAAHGRRPQPPPPPPPDLGPRRVPRPRPLARPPHRPGHRLPVPAGRRPRGPPPRHQGRHLRHPHHRPRHRPGPRRLRPRRPGRTRTRRPPHLGRPASPTPATPTATPGPPGSTPSATPAT